MSEKKLLCISPDNASPPPAWTTLLPGWQVRHVASLREAERALRGAPHQVGLVFAPGEHGNAGALDDFLRAHFAIFWVGAFEPGLLARPEWRDLAFTHLFDYHTLPLDPARLRHTLGHAHGCARLGPAGGMPRMNGQAHPHGMAGHSGAMLRLRSQIGKLGATDAPVLISGESGSGKELAARAIHAASARAAGPFVPVNCGAIAPGLIQAELFGYARGAFTGAARDKAGLIESAAGGTLLLDEIGDLPRELQANLLRVLQERTLYRLGATASIKVDVRVLAASHVDLQQAVARGDFREDLYYRLAVLPLEVPPLRVRADDITLLAEQFFQDYAADKAPRVRGFSRAALHALRAHPWPGNVRELVNRVRRAMVLAEGRLIGPHDLGLATPARADTGGLESSRASAERAAIAASLSRAGGNVTRAAQALGISRMTLYRQMAKHGLTSDLK